MGDTVEIALEPKVYVQQAERDLAALAKSVDSLVKSFEKGLPVKIVGMDGVKKDIDKTKGIFDNFGKDLQQGLGIKGITIGTALGTGIANGVGSAINGIKDMISSVVGTGFDILKQSVGSASDLQQTRIAFDVMLGSAEQAKSLLIDLQKFASQTPFTLKDVQENTKQLLGMGFALDDVLPVMKTLGNLSAGLGVPLNRLAINLGQIKAAGKLSTIDLKEFQHAGINLKEMLANQLGKTVAEVSDMVTDGAISYDQVRKALDDATSSGGRFDNMMGRQMNSFQGLSSNLEDFRDSFMRTIGGIQDNGDLVKGGLLDTLQNSLKQLLELLDKNKDKITEIGTKIGQAFGEFVNNVLPKIIDNLPQIIDDISKFISSIKFSDIKDRAEEFLNTLRTIASVIKTIGDGITLVADASDFAFKFMKFNVEGVGLAILQVKNYLDQVAAQMSNNQNELRRLKDEEFKLSANQIKNAAEAFQAFKKWGDKVNETRGVTDGLANSVANVNNQVNGLANSIRSVPNLDVRASAHKFAQGGIVRAANGIIAGNDTSGDRRLVAVNSGEMIINRNDQNALFNFIKQIGSRPQQVVNATFNQQPNQRSDRQEMNLFVQGLANL